MYYLRVSLGLGTKSTLSSKIAVAEVGVGRDLSDGDLYRKVSLYATEKSFTEALIFCIFCAWLVILLEIFAILYLPTSQETDTVES